MSFSLHQEATETDDRDFTLIVIRHHTSSSVLRYVLETLIFASLLCTTGAKVFSVDLIDENVQIIMSH